MCTGQKNQYWKEPMNTNDNITVTGEYWAYQKPADYHLKYFEFYPALGGHATSDASFKCTLNISNAERVIQKILDEKVNFPYSLLSTRKGIPYGIEIVVSGYQLFDYDLAFIEKIEEVILDEVAKNSLIKSTPPTSWEAIDFHKPTMISKLVSFYEEGICWVHTAPATDSGLESQLLRLKLHHNGKHDAIAFFEELKLILDETNIEYLKYKEYMGNYMVFLGNGRQGLNGNPVTPSNFESFKERLFLLVNRHGFSIGFDTQFVSYEAGLKKYNKLIKSDSIVVKDERLVP